MTDERILAWHFLPDDGCLAHEQPPRKVVAGETYEVAGPIVLCERGLHGSRRALDALGYAPGSVVCRTEHWGDVVEDGDKLASRYRRVVWLADATTTVHEYACWAAEWILDRLEARGHSIDARSRNAIAVKRRWLRGEATDEELAAARAAAWAAAWAAAGDAARVAAGDAARAAAGAAARAAARAAAWAAARAAAGAAARAAAGDAARAAAGDAARVAAGDAARVAAGDELDAELTRRLLALAPEGVAL